MQQLATPPEVWAARYESVRSTLLPWIDAAVGLKGATVLEYGCGDGAVACAVGPRVGRHIGVDIDARAVADGAEHVRRLGLANVELEHHPLESIMARAARLEGEVDLVLLYAVLEHMTVDERLELLAMARRVVRPTGHIVVCETPNRLLWWDHHTSQLPFFSMLPEELQLRYWDRSPRALFTAAMGAAREAGAEEARDTLVRWGRGVSFHEFELVFGDLERHVVATGFDPELFAERDLHPEEIALARFLSEHHPHLAAGWGRYWLDVILTAVPMAAPPPQVRAWSMEPGLESTGCTWTRWESIQMGGPDSRLRVGLPAPATRLVVGFAIGEERGALSATPLGADGAGDARIVPASAPPGHATYEELRFGAPVSEVELALAPSGFVTFVGWVPDA